MQAEEAHLELAADCREGEVESPVLEALLQLVHRLSTPPEAAKHAAWLRPGLGVLQDGAQSKLRRQEGFREPAGRPDK
jgi:hypothetical protein